MGRELILALSMTVIIGLRTISDLLFIRSAIYN